MLASKEVCERIHKRVFNGFSYVTDERQFGLIEYWYTTNNVDRFRGDCDDFALACRSLLLDEGVQDVRLVMCQVETGGWHLVCIAGEFVLDNRHAKVKTKFELERLGYKWHSMSGLPGDEQWYRVA